MGLGKAGVIRRAPKRKILKTVRFFDDAITNVEAHIPLYTAVKDVTLVRTVGSFQLTGANAGHAAVVIQFCINGDEVFNLVAIPGAGGERTGRAAAACLFAKSIEIAAAGDLIVVDFDIKAQRKMEGGDAIKISFLSDVAALADITGVTTQFFKE